MICRSFFSREFLNCLERNFIHGDGYFGFKRDPRCLSMTQPRLRIQLKLHQMYFASEFPFGWITASSVHVVAKRALVSVLLGFACAYRLAFTINRDSSDEDVLKAYRRALLKVHPDKGARFFDRGQPLRDPLRCDKSSLKEHPVKVSPLPPQNPNIDCK